MIGRFSTDEARRWGRALLDLFFPPVCPGCQRPGYDFCPDCAQKVEPVPNTICMCCGRPQPAMTLRCTDCQAEIAPPLHLVRAAALHTYPLREAIHSLKYGNQPELGAYLGRYLVAAFAEPLWWSLPGPIDAVVPVPLHEQRLAERGYNQSELLAAAFCEYAGLRLRPDWIRRTRFTRQQVGLTFAERQQNVAGAFEASAEVAGRAILLVDDVFTTGATLRACAAAARQAGATLVYGLALAIPAVHRYAAAGQSDGGAPG